MSHAPQPSPCPAPEGTLLSQLSGGEAPLPRESAPTRTFCPPGRGRPAYRFRRASGTCGHLSLGSRAGQGQLRPLPDPECPVGRVSLSLKALQTRKSPGRADWETHRGLDQSSQNQAETLRTREVPQLRWWGSGSEFKSQLCFNLCVSAGLTVLPHKDA